MIKGKYKWIVQERDSASNKKAICEIIDCILYNRGITTKEDKDFFFSASLEKMHNPMDLPDMKKAIERIEKAKTEKITIYGDYDVDGITSTSILYMFLKENGYDVDYYVPDRLTEGYGFNIDAIQHIKSTGTRLIISVDTGIASIKEVEYAKEIGLDIIITDHHECQEVLPKACAVINPKRPDSIYPFGELAGVGVTFKLIHGLAITWGNVNTIWKYLDIVAVGTVADIVPLVDENRIIVKYAFDTIPSTWNIGLEALLEITGNKNKKISSGIIGFQIAPRLNATGRLGDAKKGIELFTTTDKEIAKKIAHELNEENKKRQEIEQNILNLAVEKIKQTPEIKKQKVIVVASEGWHNGVLGIVSSRITEKYYKPSIVLSIENGIATGSARSIEGFSIFDALCDSSIYLDKFGGHDMAAGLSLSEKQLEAFAKHINEYAQVVMDKETLTRKIKIDCELKEEHIQLSTVEALEKLEPHGVGNPTPVFMYKGKVYSSQGIGADGKHLKMKLYTPSQSIDAVGFNMGGKEELIGQDEEIQLVGSLQKNEWLGNITPQFIVKDIQSSETENISSQYYFSLYKTLKEPTIEQLKKNVWKEQAKVTLDSIKDETGIILLVHTKQGLEEIDFYIKNNGNTFTSDVQICYISSCEQNNNIILVNGITEGIDLSKYSRIIQYEPDWRANPISNQYIISNYDYHINQLQYMIPKREDCIALYRFLKQLYSKKTNQISMHVLKRELKLNQMTEYKILQILDIFKELRLITYEYKEDNGVIIFEISEGIKTDLEKSARYICLSEFDTNLRNLDN